MFRKKLLVLGLILLVSGSLIIIKRQSFEFGVFEKGVYGAFFGGSLSAFGTMLLLLGLFGDKRAKNKQHKLSEKILSKAILSPPII